MTIASYLPRAACSASMILPSPLCCSHCTEMFNSEAVARIDWSTSSSVCAPYVAGSRMPSKFRFGPCSTKTRIGAPSVQEKRAPFERIRRMPDALLSATAAASGIAVTSVVSTDLVREIRARHDLSPTITAALGRLTTGAVLFGASLKGSERVSLQISGDGPAGAITAESWLLDEGTVIGARGYARNPHAELPVDERGKFAVGSAIGGGLLQVTKSYEVGQPYVGVVPLQTGEIAEDLAYY